MTEEKFLAYGASENGNFRIIDSIGVPHPYCITPKHLEFSQTMLLDIEGAERRSREAHPNDPRRWAVCDICRKINKKTGNPILTYAEHRQALVVECNAETSDADNKMVPELHKYLLSIKEKAEKENYVGFAFKKSEKLEKEWKNKKVFC